MDIREELTLEHCECCDGKGTDSNGITHHFHDGNDAYVEHLLLILGMRLDPGFRGGTLPSYPDVELRREGDTVAVFVCPDDNNRSHDVKIGSLSPTHLYINPVEEGQPATLINRGKEFMGDWVSTAVVMLRPFLGDPEPGEPEDEDDENWKEIDPMDLPF